ncbi:helix-turn-helix domain-containing protein [Nocardia vulneris]|uniref:TetR/AcrR family transcriptional regulator n=1 Tax=Nocardia vulneris TaxID=1141657 RepID=UPI0030D2198D
MLSTKSSSTINRVLAAASELFAEHGAPNVDLVTIIEQADVSEKSFFYHFGSKNELCERLVYDGRSQVASMIRRREAWHGPAMITLIDVWVAVLAAGPKQHMIAVEVPHADPVDGIGLLGVRRQLQAFSHRTLLRAVREGDLSTETDVAAMTRSLIATLDWTREECAGRLGTRPEALEFAAHVLSSASGRIAREYVAGYLARRYTLTSRDARWRIALVDRCTRNIDGGKARP